MATMSWVPLESNPEVMTKLLHMLGVPKEWCIVDVYGLEPDLLAMVPKPVLAVILLYPYNQKEDDEVPKKDETETTEQPPNNIYHLKQYIHNACGTIALIHSVANNLERVNLQDGFLKTFLNGTMNSTFAERGEQLINEHGITDTHKELAQEGQTEAPKVDAPVYHHFIAFVHKDGILYELDGRKPGPIDHGSTTPETLLEDSARVCKEFMTRDPDEMSFTVVALAASD